MKRQCGNCGVRPAIAKSHGPNARHRHGQKKHHDLCRQCFQAAKDRMKAQILSAEPPLVFVDEALTVSEEEFLLLLTGGSGRIPLP